MPASRLVQPLALCASLLACSSGGGTSTCVPGATAACACLGAKTGVQVCEPNGTYGACTCPGDGGSGPGLDGGRCTTSADCASSAVGPVCNSSTGACVQCASPSDCDYASPGCLDGVCGLCATSADCPSGESCSGGFCYCSGNSGCGGDAPVCSDGGQCMCTESAQCGSGDVCDQVNYVVGTCTASCTGQTDVCNPNSSPICNSAGLCVVCQTNADCVSEGFGTVCTSRGCGDCATDQDCQALDAGTPFCVGECVECRGPSDCPSSAPGCNFTTGSCGSCLQNQDCLTGMGCLKQACVPICVPGAAAGSCAPCESSADCPGAASCKQDAGVCTG